MDIMKALTFSHWKTEMDKVELQTNQVRYKSTYQATTTQQKTKNHFTRARKRWIDW